MTDDVWKSLRAQNIGGSEIASLFGESPYLSYYKLWNIKNGFILEDDLDTDDRIQSGKFLEGGAIAWANKKWGTDFYQPGVYIRHVIVSGMACTPDALSNNPDIMAQIKIVDSLQFAINWKAQGDVIIEAPLYILLQVQHEMECAKKSESWLIVLVGGNRLFHMICKYDRDIGITLCNAVEEFWRIDTAPKPDFKLDGDVINQIRKKLPEKENIDFTGDKYIYKLIRSGLAATVKRNKMQDQVEAINSEILYLVGNAANVRCGDMMLKFYKGQKTPRYVSQKEIDL